MDFPVPSNESARLKVLRELNILDTQPDERFDRIVHLAAAHFKMPVVRISLVDDDRVWFKSRIGIDAQQAPRSIAICSHAIMEDTRLVVPDLAADPRFSDSPQVAGKPHFRFYAGATITIKGGFRVGSMCLMDYVPHPEFSDDDCLFLQHLADIIEDELALHEKIFAQEQTIEARLKDIREKETAAELLIKARREAENANNAKSQFLANMSHELRTPLNAIIGYSEIMLEDAEAEKAEERISDLQKVRSSGRHLLGLINDILDISKIEAGKIELNNAPVDLMEVVSEVENTAAPLMQTNGNQFGINVSDDLSRIETDNQRLRQILLNLLGNAAKFTVNGDIDLTIKLNDDGWVLFAVRDTGIGMSAEQIERLFEPFSQGDKKITQRFGGSGLGLAISHRFIELMGGRITVENQPGVGSCFTVWLPMNGRDISIESR
ncbi:MAG: GAF domain-containing protein [Alphaproteobacteria bacterium]|nr:GAF domain-containing protein [Alphaproteobacteria bacterium]